MKIAIIVNPLIPVPPEQYGGIERIAFMLIQELKKKATILPCMPMNIRSRAVNSSVTVNRLIMALKIC
ncbi:hypothetical protein ACQ86K_03000 [Mucilaginibacter sp. P19]|uniref:hypothetical protein n=1 Tax=Mucilaginibacter sp. P19 TaxID=3423947 RepID=UPI003D67C39E